MDSPLLVEVDQVVKSFGGVKALRGVDFTLRGGEIHALLGENGAGKSTLIKILAGILAPDSGSVTVEGKRGAVRSVADASALGIRVIHQELSLAPNLTIAENIYLGVEPHRGGFLRRRELQDRAARLIEDLGLSELRDVSRPVSALNVAHRQLVEIARALSREARVLILDEPTSALSGAETEALFSTLRRLRERGAGLIYISHRLEEILQLADRITVLRDGRSIGVRPREAVDRRELVRWMVDRDLGDLFPRPARQPGAVVLEVEGLSNEALRGVSFTLRSGEILGIAGLVGSGRTELARALFGIDRTVSGELRLLGKSVKLRSPSEALKAGVVLVPEDRSREGLVMIQSLAFNLALPWTSRWCRGIRPNLALRRKLVGDAVAGFRIKVTDPEISIASLSGGNQQKALVGRWMVERPRVLILDEPTRGVDVGAREDMFATLSGLVEEGIAVVLISSDLSEVLGLSHRVALLSGGRILGTVDPRNTSAEEVMAALTGAQLKGRETCAE